MGGGRVCAGRVATASTAQGREDRQSILPQSNSIGEIVPEIFANFTRRTAPFTSPIRHCPRIHRLLLIELRH